MKFGKFTVTVAMVVASGFSSSSLLAHGPELGKAAPPLTLSRVLQAPANTIASWEALRGKVVVIDFWATWCGPCRESIPHWNRLVDTFKDRPVVFMAITDEHDQIVSAFLKRTPIHSWVGLDGVGLPMRDLYRIAGIPATVVVNQEGVVVAVIHPVGLEPKHIEEVLNTGNSSLPPPVEAIAKAGDNGAGRDSAKRPQCEVSVRRSGPLPAGSGVDCWVSGQTRDNVSGKYASVKQAVLTLFKGSDTLLDCRTALPTEAYDFTFRLPGASRADCEQAAGAMFRTVFGLNVHRTNVEREVYVLALASTNAPGLTLSTTNSSGFSSTERGGFKQSRATMDGLPPCLEYYLGKTVVDETGLTNRYDMRVRWKMSKSELLPEVLDRRVLAVVEKPDAAKEEKLSNDQRRQVAAIRGQLPEAEWKGLPAEDRENIELLRAELAKPDDERYAPDLAAILAAVREQLGLDLSLQRRTMPVLVVEKAQAEE